MRAYGGKTVYGASVGILMLETKFPRIPGDIGHAGTFDFPTLYRVVRGATGERVTSADPRKRADDLLQSFLEAADDLVACGVDGLTTSCGFLSIFQKEIAAHCKVPVATSALMQIPWVERILPPGKRVGVLTYWGERLTPAHLEAAGANPETPVLGLENGKEFWRYMRDGCMEMDVDQCAVDLVAAARGLVRTYEDIGAIVLECTNMPPFAAAISADLKLPVFDIHTFVCWFQAGLAPRRF